MTEQEQLLMNLSEQLELHFCFSCQLHHFMILRQIDDKVHFFLRFTYSMLGAVLEIIVVTTFIHDVRKFLLKMTLSLFLKLSMTGPLPVC
ncbi:hypothetical protein CRD36_02050 [Paremcibacter congregatus]|uniref:Uncharacterized protein n=1 Tax=Paremcibacter congregatus TaxID=2043170 RepID=A0A2G4YVM3_9PROT|nr:hypothetical protein CRD36_02050 [Paremcibacter congregatus]